LRHGHAAAPGTGRPLDLRTRIELVALPALVALGWAIYIRLRLNWPQPGDREFSLPFVGYVDSWTQFWSKVGNWGDAVVAFLLLPAACAVGVLWWRRRSILLAAALPFALIVPILSAQVLNVSINSLRAFGPAILLLMVDVGVWVFPRVRASQWRLPLGLRLPLVARVE
jgi:hypothetical protein